MAASRTTTPSSSRRPLSRPPILSGRPGRRPPGTPGTGPGWSGPGNLDAGEQLKLKQTRAACPQLDALRGHVEEFAKMITGLHGDRLDAWIAAVRTDDLPHLHTFANGLERDHAAVLSGLTLPYSSGAVEGKVAKIKFWKRLMSGRANLDLLRKMALWN
jgi:transposase